MKERFTLPECTIEYDRYGEGAPMVLLHPSSGVRVTRAVKALRQQFTVYQPILPGFDGTTAPGGMLSVRRLAAWVAAFLSKIPGTPAIVVGHSFGGWIATWVALDRPDLVESLVLQSPLGFGPLATASATATPSEVLARTYTHPEKRLPDMRPEEMLGHNRALARRYGKERTVDAELMEQLPSLGVPTLVIYGENDGLIQLAGLEAMVSHSTASTLRIVKDAAHHVESDQPEQYVELIARFVAQHSRTHLGA